MATPRKKTASTPAVPKPEWQHAVEAVSKQCQDAVHAVLKQCQDRDESTMAIIEARDKMHADNYARSLKLIDEIAPWVKANIEREVRRKQLTDRLYHIAMNEVTAMVVKAIGWVAALALVLYVSGTPFGKVVRAAITASAGLPGM